MGENDKMPTKLSSFRAKKEWLKTAKTLTEALPFLLEYDNEVVVVKFGGHAMVDDKLAADFARDIVLLKQTGVNPVIVHGGGPQIGEMLNRLSIESDFVDGLRVTGKETVEVVEMVLAGKINKQIVSAITTQGGKAVGLSGKDGNMIVARKLHRTQRDPGSNIERILDLGFVGEPDEINADILETIITSDIIPVIAPIGVCPNGDTYNINADTVAGAIAAELLAKRLVLLTDVAGILDKKGELLEVLDVDEAKALTKDGTVSGGMIPKLQTCIDSVEKGVEAVVILDGRVPHVLLLELFTDQGAGTLIGG